jgi:hypothetical protein
LPKKINFWCSSNQGYSHPLQNELEDQLWKLVELRSVNIPTGWSGRFNWVKMFELIATLYLCLKEEEHVDMDMKKENSGLAIVPKEETLAVLLSFREL